MFCFIKKITQALSGKKPCCTGCKPSKTVSLNISEADKEILKNIDENIVVGKIKSIRPHTDPKVTKVQVTETEVAPGEIKQILCGASNIKEGLIVPVATVGTDLGGGFVITERAIRGETSFGMICTKDELGLSKETDGIWEMPSELEPKLGQPLKHLV